MRSANFDNQALVNQLESMFDKMSGSGRKQTLENQKQLISFTVDFTKKQAEFMRQFSSIETPFPDKDTKITTPESIQAANQQMDPYLLFKAKKEAQIDASAQKLVEFNKDMSASLNNFINSTSAHS